MSDYATPGQISTAMDAELADYLTIDQPGSAQVLSDYATVEQFATERALDGMGMAPDFESDGSLIASMGDYPLAEQF